jgi:hypothetical protein
MRHRCYAEGYEGKGPEDQNDGERKPHRLIISTRFDELKGCGKCRSSRRNT